MVFRGIEDVIKAPRGGAGGGERSDGPTRAPKREGRGRADARGGWVGTRLGIDGIAKVIMGFEVV